MKQYINPDEERGTAEVLSDTRLIQQIIEEKGPLSVRVLIQQVASREPSYTEPMILDALEALKRKGSIILSPPRFGSFPSFFVNLQWNLVFWIALLMSIFYLALYPLSLGFPWSLSQISLGLGVFFLLPGHNLLRILARTLTLPVLERFLLDVATSMFLILVMGLFLNFSPLGLVSSTALGPLIGLGVFLAGFAAYDEYRRTHRVRISTGFSSGD